MVYFAGKTTELLRRVRRFTIANYKCCVLKYAKDIRYSEECAATHDKVTSAAFPCCELFGFRDAQLYDVIGIDEGQFFSDVVRFAEEMANLGKIVIIAALDGTFQRKPFGHVLDLIPLAENVVKLSAVCLMCHSNGSFTRRLGTETQVELIGGAETYTSVCRKCFFRSSTQTTPNKKRVYADISQTGFSSFS
jgi:thymidine kinase